MGALTVTLDDRERLLDRLLEDGVAIAHDCGGVLACSSCNVLIQEGAHEIDPPGDDELDLLDRGGVCTPAARLACQVSGAADLVVVVPPRETPTHERIQPITVTDQAARYLSQQLAKYPGAVAVRLGVEPAGCSGFGYRIEHAGEIGRDDEMYQAGEIRVLVDRKSLPFVQGTRVELVKEDLTRRLRFDNPNARQSCGCGESFGL